MEPKMRLYSHRHSCQLPSSSDEHSPSRQTALANAAASGASSAGLGGSGSLGTSSSLGGGGGGGGGSLPHQSTTTPGNDHFNRLGLEIFLNHIQTIVTYEKRRQGWETAFLYFCASLLTE